VTKNILVLSTGSDPHARWAAQGVARLGGRCHVAASDRLADAGHLSWNAAAPGAVVTDAEGTQVAVDDADVIWWRRSNSQVAIDKSEPDAALINRCAASAWIGALLLDPCQKVIDDPFQVFRAENKLIQLAAAKRVGLAAPDTLISNDPAEIRDFAGATGSIVAKTLRHTPEHMLETVPVSPDQLRDDEALRLCPTIYQKMVPGDRHLRLLAFGNDLVGVELQSPHLDWRGRKELSAMEYEADDGLKTQCHALLASLGLSMAIFDFKLGPDGPVFLEINPQGQFLFMEILGGAQWEDRFAAFLMQ